jgi:hypothetical protein
MAGFARNGRRMAMGNDKKIQGEGDYASARRYQDDARQFVEEHTKGGKTIKGNAEEATDQPTAAEREGLAHARDGAQDERDAERMRKLEQQDD